MNTSSTSLLRLIADPLSSASSEEQLLERNGPVVQLPLEQISEPEGEHAVRRTYDMQALEDLAVSLRLHGLLHPIGVRPLGPNQYRLIYGSRRLRAAQLAGWTTIAATLRLDLEHDADQAFVLSLAENLQRAHLGGAELATALRVLAGLAEASRAGPRISPEQPRGAKGLARRLGLSTSTISRWIGVTRQPELLEAVETGSIDLVHAARIATAPPDGVIPLLHEVLNEEMSLPALDLRLRELRHGRQRPTANIKQLRLALGALERIQSIDGDVEAELVEHIARQMSRIRRVAGGRARAPGGQR